MRSDLGGRRREGLCLALLSTLFWVVGPLTDVPAAQRPATRVGGAQPPRDSQPTTAASGVIRGRVVGDVDGTPIRRARVTARLNRPPRGPVTRRSIEALMFTTMTDMQGRYELRDLPAADYSLSAEKVGYLRTSYREGTSDAGPVSLTADAELDNANFRLRRGAVIAGRVLDNFGDPVPEARVSALRNQFFNGGQRLMPAQAPRTTDDLGQYRLYGLAPGEYYLSVQVRNTGSLSGDARQATGYAPTFYPRTTNVAEAQAVRVAVGQELFGVDLVALETRTARVSGVAIDLAGAPLTGAMVTLQSAQRTVMFMPTFGFGQVEADGRFELRDVAPGDYIVQATRGRRGYDDYAIAMARVTVTGDDIEQLPLVAAPGATISGELVTVDGNLPPFPLSRVQISTRPDPLLRLLSSRSEISEEGTFELRDLFGPHLIRVNFLPPDWALDAVLLDGQDVIDTPVESVTVGAATRLRLVVTNVLSHVEGTIVDARGEPEAATSVIIFAADDRRWTFLSRFVSTSRSDRSGMFRIRLPPASYLAVAVTDLPRGAAADPTFLDSLRGPATPFILDEGETQVLSLEVTEVP